MRCKLLLGSFLLFFYSMQFTFATESYIDVQSGTHLQYMGPHEGFYSNGTDMYFDWKVTDGSVSVRRVHILASIDDGDTWKIIAKSDVKSSLTTWKVNIAQDRAQILFKVRMYSYENELICEYFSKKQCSIDNVKPVYRILPWKFIDKAIEIPYEVIDEGGSGIKNVELWYKKNGNWVFYWAQTKPSGIFTLYNRDISPGKISVALVISDKAGNVNAKHPSETKPTIISYSQKSDVDIHIDDVQLQVKPSTDTSDAIWSPLPSVVSAGSTLRINWTIDDAKIEKGSINLSYKMHGKSDWIPLAESLANTGSYDSWVVNTLQGTITDVRLSVKDKRGNVITYVKAVPLYVDGLAPEGDLELPSLWALERPLEIPYSVIDRGYSTVAKVELWKRPSNGNWEKFLEHGSTIERVFQTNIVDGSYDFALVAQDAIGNRMLTPEEGGVFHSIVVDRRKPDAVLLSPADNIYDWDGKEIAVQWNVNDANIEPASIRVWAADQSGVWELLGSQLEQQGRLMWLPASVNTSFRFKIVARDLSGKNVVHISKPIEISLISFSVSSSLKKGDVLRKGEKIGFTWESTLKNGMVVVEMSTDRGETWNIIGTNRAHQEQLECSIIGDDDAEHCMIRTVLYDGEGKVLRQINDPHEFIIDNTAPRISVSVRKSKKNIFFNLSGSALVLSSIAGGSNVICKWRTNYLEGIVTIDLTVDDKKSWKNIQSIAAKEGMTSVTLPQVDASSCFLRIRLQDEDGNVVRESISPHSFMIDTSPPKSIGVKVSSSGSFRLLTKLPEDDKVISGGSEMIIRWISTLREASVDVMVSTDGGNTWDMLIKESVTARKLICTLPKLNANECYLRVRLLSEKGIVLHEIMSPSAFVIDSTPPKFTIRR